MLQRLQSFGQYWNHQLKKSSNATSLILERLYYAEGRHNPGHPLHGRFDGLDISTRA